MFTLEKIQNLSLNLFCIWLFVDCINGFLLTNSIGIPISQLYKIIILGLLSITLLKQDKGLYHIYIILGYIIILILHLSINSVNPQLGKTLNHIMRFLMTIMIYFSIKNYAINNSLKTYIHINKVFTINSYVLVINILLGLVGIGYSSYAEGLGYKGFFYAGNEISGLMIIIFPFILYKMGECYSYRSHKYIGTAIIFLTTAALLGTKTSILHILITIVVLPNLDFKHKNITKIILGVSIGLFILLGGFYILLDNLGLIERWIYFYEKGGVENLIFSGRTEFWNEEKKTILNSNLVNQIFGLGGSQTVEMDPFDTFLNYGYIGLVMCYAFYFYLLFISIKTYKNKNSRLVIFINITIIMASSFAGHILYSGMASCFIALINILVYIPHSIIKNKNEKDLNNIKSVSF